MVVSGPSPGKMPTTVPRKAPMKQYIRFSPDRTIEKPLSRASIGAAAQRTSARKARSMGPVGRSTRKSQAKHTRPMREALTP